MEYHRYITGVTLWKINSSTLKITHIQWKLIFQPLSARVYVNLLEGNIFHLVHLYIYIYSKYMIYDIDDLSLESGRSSTSNVVFKKVDIPFFSHEMICGLITQES